MAERILLEAFLEMEGQYPLVDVRSPSEYEMGHIPGAINIPMFDDEERRIVGTTYKQVNREAAIYRGLEFIGPKMAALVKQAERAAGGKKTLVVHCWRGGMRSASMAWLFETIGLKCHVLDGGYKRWRTWLRSQFSQAYELRVLGGRTGSGKTAILHQLVRQGEQVIDLEGLAHHKGSAFGSLGEPPQPSTEQFENDLGIALAALDRGRRTWIEDESRNIGKCVLPPEFYEQMCQSEMYFLDISRELRAGHLVGDYASFDKEELIDRVLRIKMKLGGDRSSEAVEAIRSGDFFKTALITLEYYDKAYMFSLEKNHSAYRLLPTQTIDPGENAALLLENEEKRRS